MSNLTFCLEANLMYGTVIDEIRRKETAKSSKSIIAFTPKVITSAIEMPIITIELLKIINIGPIMEEVIFLRFNKI